MHNILENPFTGEKKKKKEGGNLSTEKIWLYTSKYLYSGSESKINDLALTGIHVFLKLKGGRGWSTVTTGFSQKTDTIIRNLNIFFLISRYVINMFSR